MDSKQWKVLITCIIIAFPSSLGLTAGDVRTSALATIIAIIITFIGKKYFEDYKVRRRNLSSEHLGFKFLLPYTEKDPIELPFRKPIIQNLATRISHGMPITVITGEVGAGKTSVIRCGLLKHLNENRIDYHFLSSPLVLLEKNSESDNSQKLQQWVSSCLYLLNNIYAQNIQVLIIDQLEEFLSFFPKNAQTSEALANVFLTAFRLNVMLIIGMRSDIISSLDYIYKENFIDNYDPNHDFTSSLNRINVSLFTIEEAAEIISSLASNENTPYSTIAAKRISSNISIDGWVRAVDIQIICYYLIAEKRTINTSILPSNQISFILQRHLLEAIKDTKNEDAAKNLLLSLIDRVNKTKKTILRDYLQNGDEKITIDQRTKNLIIRVLSERFIIKQYEDKISLVHDSLIEVIISITKEKLSKEERADILLKQLIDVPPRKKGLNLSSFTLIVRYGDKLLKERAKGIIRYNGLKFSFLASIITLAFISIGVFIFSYLMTIPILLLSHQDIYAIEANGKDLFFSITPEGLTKICELDDVLTQVKVVDINWQEMSPVIIEDSNLLFVSSYNNACVMNVNTFVVYDSFPIIGCYQQKNFISFSTYSTKNKPFKNHITWYTPKSSITQQKLLSDKIIVSLSQKDNILRASHSDKWVREFPRTDSIVSFTCQSIFEETKSAYAYIHVTCYLGEATGYNTSIVIKTYLLNHETGAVLFLSQKANLDQLVILNDSKYLYIYSQVFDRSKNTFHLTIKRITLETMEESIIRDQLVNNMVLLNGESLILLGEFDTVNYKYVMHGNYIRKIPILGTENLIFLSETNPRYGIRDSFRPLLYFDNNTLKYSCSYLVGDTLKVENAEIIDVILKNNYLLSYQVIKENVVALITLKKRQFSDNLELHIVNMKTKQNDLFTIRKGIDLFIDYDKYARPQCQLNTVILNEKVYLVDKEGKVYTFKKQPFVWWNNIKYAIFNKRLKIH
ncbi:hypothetical protein BH09BAC1_BH09BAC1_17580 [soil metagenome]